MHQLFSCRKTKTWYLGRYQQLQLLWQTYRHKYGHGRVGENPWYICWQLIFIKKQIMWPIVNSESAQCTVGNKDWKVCWPYRSKDFAGPMVMNVKLVCMSNGQASQILWHVKCSIRWSRLLVIFWFTNIRQTF